MVAVPPRWILEPTDKAFAQGSDAKVECKSDGFPKVRKKSNYHQNEIQFISNTQ